MIGKGSFGDVFICKFRNFHDCAVKQLNNFKANSEKAKSVLVEGREGVLQRQGSLLASLSSDVGLEAMIRSKTHSPPSQLRTNRKDFMDEIKLMCSLSHPCTVRLYAWTETPIAVIMELAICDLRQYYTGKSDVFGAYSYLSALEVLLDAARGLLVGFAIESLHVFTSRFLSLFSCSCV